MKINEPDGQKRLQVAPFIPLNPIQTMIQILFKPKEERKDRDFTLIAPILKEINFFKQRNIISQDITYLCQELSYEYFTQGECVFKYGEHGAKFYIILQGKVEIMVPDLEKR